MAGWAPFDTEGWGEVAEALTASGVKWHESVAIFDMRVDVRENGRPHGRPYYVKRWRWTDWAVKQLFLSEEKWSDPTQWTSGSTASPPPAHHQPTTSRPPAGERANADNGAASASPPPAHHQPTTSEPPRARLPKKKEEKKKDTQSVSKSDGREVHAHWRLYHPRAGAPNNSDLLKIMARLSELRADMGDLDSAKADLLTLIDYMHTAPDAAFWQGDNPKGKKYLGITPHFKPENFSDRLEASREWEAAGKSTTKSQPSGGSFFATLEME